MSLRIRELRKARGLTQQDLASMAHISRSQLAEIEAETRPGNTLRLSAIARALNVDVAELFDQKGRKTYEREILRLAGAMDDADREALLRMARALARPA